MAEGRGVVARWLRNRLADADTATELWRGPVMLGLSAALLLWVVWYFTKAPCTMENAHAGLCNAAPIARYIDHQILGQCILLGIAVAALRGGYNEIMVSRERKRADEAEERLRQERKRADARIEELLADRRAERERQEAERARLEAERQAERELDRVERQAMLNAMVQISNTLERLAANQQNGQSPPQE